LWVTEGTRTAVILGDLLVSLAVEAIQEVLPSHLSLLTSALREMCDAEAEQEFAGIEAGTSWERCVGIARRKTGSLFGFAAACAGGSEPERVEALRRAGYAMGTAYQLADDLLDACAAPWASDKSLGRDAATGKLTAASASPPGGMTPHDAIASLLRNSEYELVRWPHVQAAWHSYVGDTMAPLLAQGAEAARMEAIA
jgi:geranylgeranyl pyrophosphate synthase